MAAAAAPPPVAAATLAVPGRVDRAFAVAAAMAEHLRRMAAVQPVAPPPVAPASPEVTAIATAPAVRAGRSAFAKPALPRPHEQASGRTGFALCSHFRTYDATSGTYRGFDGVVHACRPIGHDAPAAPREAAAPVAPVAPVPENAAIAAKIKAGAGGSTAFPW